MFTYVLPSFMPDETLDWVAELECGHQRHVRHNPPWPQILQLHFNGVIRLDGKRTKKDGNEVFQNVYPSIVQHDTQEGSIDFNSAIVLDETELPEFVHEQIDPRAGCANHLRQSLLRYFLKSSFRVILLTVLGKQQKSAREPLLGRVE